MGKTLARAGNDKPLSQIEEPIQKRTALYASATFNADGIATRNEGQSCPLAPAEPGQAGPLHLFNDTEAAGNQPSQTSDARG
jgi:hypothetical protein